MSLLQQSYYVAVLVVVDAAVSFATDRKLRIVLSLLQSNEMNLKRTMYIKNINMKNQIL